MSLSGYTLPVFACASAMAALHWLRHRQPLTSVSVDLIEPPQIAEISIEQVAGLCNNTALAITRSEPGDNLDLTRNTPIWAMVQWRVGDGENVIIQGGEGVGKQINADNQPAIYAYAQKLLQDNLNRMLADDEKITVNIILPEGRSLAVRTSNSAFGVVEGLSLLGTSGISQPLSTPDQLGAFRRELQHKATRFQSLVFCIGENGLDLARQLGINPEQLVKTANWLGPLLVEADLLGVKEILLFGYHGKLMKLAGGIFHTHHHLADGRREILAAHCALAGLKSEDIGVVFHSPTAEDALKHLKYLDAATGSDWVNQVYGAMAEAIDSRSQEYIQNHSQRGSNATVCGSVLFDRHREIIIKSKIGCLLSKKLC
ncbi:cobalt-precorrin-5B (C(1))-methyltransferase CbiD [Umezakia ovalisporum]|jgi:cobalt-precorrin-5B (C1)-methyltransferase|uniref:Cobalt-precorrin-5B C(1)-methyltransferase n=2 Tax=Umezakia ovalisporum TaxID=75695 RepID=A0AA43H0F6_9CYAN|nr:cobalt-precorrin-5B (C(1))-methyltransferase CbiD [Umezakia ovalisporum]MBI1242245.1 cobalt-precorrin-5B (C(1))-methyltransferase [Nostoc sp. RI_552]MDH6057097.1 cobalt-precorrin-5B (C(1))-methyltransferase CbiD [Umezakia ovalisporum FSS-43]MDH6065046.1 cobalt-precorrin-5B (C(1))-methyltransferase CbiD [Umezakia ovalisporum FSS-62]MDH6067171.1 cobalt-precorrin-5B (C(1))-methyltransferase CbiD [Umezakia ovalisporum APH033B]MDH6071410.1 cobalt-precorrin-5B (C(1))-methyltransferase CbiD [Umeza